MTYDAGVEGIAADRHSAGGDDLVRARAGFELDDAEIAGSPAEICDQNEFAGAQALRIRVGGSDRLIGKIDLVKARDGIGSAQAAQARVPRPPASPPRRTSRAGRRGARPERTELLLDGGSQDLQKNSDELFQLVLRDPICVDLERHCWRQTISKIESAVRLHAAPDSVRLPRVQPEAWLGLPHLASQKRGTDRNVSTAVSINGNRATRTSPPDSQAIALFVVPKSMPTDGSKQIPCTFDRIKQCCRDRAICFPVLALASNLIENPGFKEIGPGAPANWSTWSPSSGDPPEIRSSSFRSRGCAIHSNRGKATEYGKWITAPLRVDAGKFYSFEVEFRTQNVKSEDVSVAAMLSWFNGPDKQDAAQRDYIDKVDSSHDWKRMSAHSSGACRRNLLRVELIFRWAEKGSVQWRTPVLSKVDAPAPRNVRVATSHIRPPPPHTIESNLKRMTDMIDAAGNEKADIICLSEGLAERGVNGSLETRAHPVPGLVTERLGSKRKKEQALGGNRGSGTRWRLDLQHSRVD